MNENRVRDADVNDRCNKWLAANGWAKDDFDKCPCRRETSYEALYHCRDCHEVIDCSDSDLDKPPSEFAWCSSCWQREKLRRATERAEKAEAKLAAIEAVLAMHSLKDVSQDATPGGFSFIGKTVFVLNTERTNRISFSVGSGHDNFGQRTSLAECERTAETIAGSVNAVRDILSILK